MKTILKILLIIIVAAVVLSFFIDDDSKEEFKMPEDLHFTYCGYDKESGHHKGEYHYYLFDVENQIIVFVEEEFATYKDKEYKYEFYAREDGNRSYYDSMYKEYVEGRKDISVTSGLYTLSKTNFFKNYPQYDFEMMYQRAKEEEEK